MMEKRRSLDREAKALRRREGLRQVKALPVPDVARNGEGLR
jgi:hypothetical protein